VIVIMYCCSVVFDVTFSSVSCPGVFSLTVTVLCVQSGHSPGKPGKSGNLRVVGEKSWKMCSCMHKIWPVGSQESH